MNNATNQCTVAAAAQQRAVPQSRVDFDRPLVSILGLPFDAISLEQAVQRIRRDAFDGRRCFVSTPNLNFAIAARSDPAFRDSVLRSDLSLVDGMPLVWIARLLGLPVPQRVSGADVFSALQAHGGPPVSVYLFGGPGGAAARACDAINALGGGIRCVGFETPGFGSVESMSGDAQIARINESGAQFVVVALGAKKGQAWIEHNAARLTAPVLSHLGAVVNFAAGTVQRAPNWMQWCGLEWLWRIKEEPPLWRRYWSDGVIAAGLLLTRVVPDAIESRLRTHGHLGDRHIQVLPAPGEVTLRLNGAWRDDDLGELRAALAQCAVGSMHVTIDLSAVVAVADRFVALLLLARGWFDRRGGLDIVGANRQVIATMRLKLADDLIAGAKL